MTHPPRVATFKTLKDTTLRDRARAMRHDDTDPEARLWNSAVLDNRDGVRLMILEACGGEHLSMGSG